METDGMTQWEKYLKLAEDEAARTNERFQDAGTYANTVETAETTDEDWATSFFTVYGDA